MKRLLIMAFIFVPSLLLAQPNGLKYNITYFFYNHEDWTGMQEMQQTNFVGRYIVYYGGKSNGKHICPFTDMNITAQPSDYSFTPTLTIGYGVIDNIQIKGNNLYYYVSDFTEVK